ncbi:YdbL family protein [Qipengyuania sp. DSG2-2]|uniref:YdbL family protein n=1 Tax=Qipengyuania sp. DGS2-2 TaxID=3349631 RepID=UPI0036D22E84
MSMQAKHIAKAGLLGLAALSLAIPTSAMAQRDPAYAAARANGSIGEKMDGYLGVVGNQDASIRKLVADLNIKRRANYTQRAQGQNATIEEYAFTQGCVLINRTVPGEKYQAPSGNWETRGSAAPQRDPRCP